MYYYRQQPTFFPIPGFPPSNNSTNRRIERLENQVQRLEQQFDRLERRLERVERRIGINHPSPSPRPY
ncbi:MULTISPECIES: hypothetical protein [Cytobacillus]|uniref:Uncharacterized protein n=1 Tax=Cytobacillus stercorigallinarum TaxID=2762240 RepID=A0ABR8QIX9_9BACI|nr:hypothetical protein [Cytobacillus stercorigallinarum]MBD7935470.1 hypothetical protein [Cytobacillus stercorigallinarum]